ncbi:membrane protein insertase YidC [Bombilactobacillus thymidiniphilus]|uniref:Membrane protein insertase YidC n=1 Tax=Bombilactobacillus thymidiniphilus TaxID=2923363 RepID=A0ABY4PC84_9LACO|nr:membrane protein insertase YidC [Bombilactobacillus thymidiniphilus]UQS83375.1 membrane protein insertase YidC [Bombilactobacillus thymidiniphilus]
MKKNFKKILIAAGLLGLLVTVSACSHSGINVAAKAPTSGPYGFIYHYLGIPFQNLILAMSNIIGGQDSYAWGIIIISFIVRLLLLPLSLWQQRKSILQQEKMKLIQPQLKLIQEQQKNAKTQEEQAKISQLMMQVYSKNNIKLTGGLGCLPLLLQFPVFIAIYQAVQYSSEISKATFWGAPLAKPSIIITIIATLFYVLQSWMSLKNIPAEQKQQMKMMMFLSPAMTFFISIASSTALALYFLIGGVIIVIQQVISDYLITPRVRKQVDAEIENNPIVTVVTEDTLKQSVATSSKENNPSEQPASQLHDRNRKRNAGKQQHHK